MRFIYAYYINMVLITTSNDQLLVNGSVIGTGGSQGAQGPQGEQGIQGDQGEQGNDASSIICSTDGINWTSTIGSTSSSIFRGVAGNSNVGAVKINSQLVCDKSIGLNPTQTIVVNTGAYCDKSVGELLLTIKYTSGEAP